MNVRMGEQNSVKTVSISKAMLAEIIGTFLLVFFGCGVVHAAVLTEAQIGLWQVAVVWGIGIMLAIFAVDKISGAHINPAITLSFAVWGRHSWSRVLPYFAAQLTGAILAAALLFFLFSGFIAAKEKELAVVRGKAGSELTAMCYGEYFPNPGMTTLRDGKYDLEAHNELKALVPQTSAFLAEFIGTMILAGIVFAITDKRNQGRPLANLAPVFIGLTVSVLISVLAPLTQACFNPARDFGPRLFAFYAGWESIALPGFSDTGWLTVYILAPFLGAIAGGGLAHFALLPIYAELEA